MQFNFKTLQVKVHDQAILVLELNRPAVRNAINSDMMTELSQFWQMMNHHTHSIKCIILTGGGSAFCAGADLKERYHLSLEKWQSQHLVFEKAMLTMIDCPLPVIAAVNGAAFGGGLELALACDFIYAANTATFAQPEVKIGIMPAALGTQHLPSASSLRRAKELILTGASFSAEEAASWGIVNQVLASDQLMKAVMLVAEQIVKNAPLAVKEAKKALNISQQLDIKSGFAEELKGYNRLLLTADREEGIKAFNEKRPAIFTGL